MPVAKRKLAPFTWKQLIACRNQGMDDLFVHPPILETRRLILRPLQMADAADLFAYASDPAVARYVLWSAHQSIHDSQAFIRWIMGQYRQGIPSSFGVCHRADGRMIGTMGFTGWVEEDRMAEIGYSFSRAYWGQGIATEALDRMLQYCFDTLNLHRVEGQHDASNPASGRVMEKAGMKKEGLLRGRVWNKDRFVDTVMYGILRDDWVAAHPSSPAGKV